MALDDETLTADDFAFSPNTKGERTPIASMNVSDDTVLFANLDRPVVCDLTTTQTVTVSANSVETKTLDPEAPRVPHLDDPVNGQYSKFASLVGWFADASDDDGDGDVADKDNLLTDQSAVKVVSYTATDNFIREIELENTTGSPVDVKFYSVVRSGYARVMRRSSGGAGTMTDQLLKKRSFELAFSDHHVPEGGREINWPDDKSGVDGTVPPDFYVDIEFYSDEDTIAVPASDGTVPTPTNMMIRLPFERRDVKDSEDPAELRETVRQSMA